MGQDPSYIKTLFELCDKDGSGYLERNELQYLAASLGKVMDEGQLDELMNILDGNHDGRVSLQEFTTWFWFSKGQILSAKAN